MNSKSDIKVRLHFTNVAGTGATQLLKSLLPALERVQGFSIEKMFLPDRGSLSSYSCKNPSTAVVIYKRFLPNILSRLLECIFFAGRFSGPTALLVFGDLPLRCHAPQVVFVQNSHLLRPKSLSFSSFKIKYWVARLIFGFNEGRVLSFIVQTDWMRSELERSYPAVTGRIHVIPQPVPVWLLNSNVSRHGRSGSRGGKLRLFYPAAGYSHKNHSLLGKLDKASELVIDRVVLTLDPSDNPAPQHKWVECSGFFSPQKMVSEYAQADALLFLSRDESYGFPLIEAMFVGLPIVCPDLPYAHILCGEDAIYFDPDSPVSLLNSLEMLQRRLDDGWWPNWRDRVSTLPIDWENVALRMLNITCSTR